MSHYPPQYGIAANFKKGKIKPNKSPDPEPEITSPGTTQIRLSVMKGLWFPIMSNLTNLAMDNQNIENKVFSMETLFQILEHGIQPFDLNFWREILSQVLFPMLEDIDLAIQTPIRKNDDNGVQFYLQTIQ